MVCRRNIVHALGLWHRRTPRWQEPQSGLYWLPQELPSDLASDHLGEEGWHRIAQHALHAVATAVEPKVIRKSLETAQLSCRKMSTGPMERPGGGPRLRLDGP